MTLSRRRLLELAGVGGVAAIAGGGVALLADDERSKPDTNETIPFRGAHQAGILTAQQQHLRFASYDLTAADANDVRDLLRAWTDAAARLSQGDSPTGPADAYAPPDDTGETNGLGPANLTVTFGFGPGLFTSRYGLTRRRPAALVDLPRFQRDDHLDPNRSGGDLCVQACANDPQVAFHAIRNLTRTAHGAASLRWLQEGFLSPPTTGSNTPRNLMGFRDGTANLDPTDANLMNRNVWAAVQDGPTWMAGGTYLVARKIRIRIEQWDRTALGEQERFIGRSKTTGAPIGMNNEHDPVTTSRLDIASHIRLANPRTGTNSDNERILRRGYNFSDGIDEIGQIDAGLFFLAYQRDPRKQFIPIQTRLASDDLLNEYLFHTGSAIFAIPPGTQPTRHIGHQLFHY